MKRFKDRIVKDKTLYCKNCNMVIYNDTISPYCFKCFKKFPNENGINKNEKHTN